jgi:hypothetical protein
MLSTMTMSPYFAVVFSDEILFELAPDAVKKSPKNEVDRLRGVAIGVGRTAGLLAQWKTYISRWTANIRQAENLGGPPDRERGWLDFLMPQVHELVDNLYGPLSMPPWLTEQRRTEAL